MIKICLIRFLSLKIFFSVSTRLLTIFNLIFFFFAMKPQRMITSETSVSMQNSVMTSFKLLFFIRLKSKKSQSKYFWKKERLMILEAYFKILAPSMVIRTLVMIFSEKYSTPLICALCSWLTEARIRLSVFVSFCCSFVVIIDFIT